MKIAITPSKALKTLLIVIALLVIAGVASKVLWHTYGGSQLKNIERLFDLDGEANIPSFYSALALLAASILLFFIARSTAKTRRDYFAWLGMSVVFLYLAFDEAAMLHEMLIGTVRRDLHLSGLLYNAWILPYGVAMIAGGILYLPFLYKLPKQTLWLFILSGVIFVSGAVGVEMIEGLYEEAHGTDNLVYDLYVVVEESLEMIGVALFIYALLKYIGATSREITLHVR